MVSVAGRDGSATAAAIASLDPPALALQGKVLVVSKSTVQTTRPKRLGRIAILPIPAGSDASIQFTENSLGHPAHLKCRPFLRPPFWENSSRALKGHFEKK
jgi:hypothetical protein